MPAEPTDSRPRSSLGSPLLVALLLAVVVLMALLMVAPPARGDDASPEQAKACCHKAPGAADAALPAGMTELAEAPAPPRGAGAAVTLLEAKLVDQDGRAVRFPADVVGDRIVVMDFVFTTCTTICPILSAKLTRLQERLGDRAGREVRLVSFSIDPARDTPARLKAFGARFKAGPGWTWLTGEVGDVERVLKGLGAYTPDFTSHPPMLLVGDGRTGRFVRLNGFPDPDKLLATVDELVAARGTVAATAAEAAR
jgi:protein SCO1